MIRLIPQPLFTEQKNGKPCVKADSLTVKSDKLNTLFGKGSYRLVVRFDGIFVQYEDDSGLFYAKKTLEQLKKLYDGVIPQCTIEDAPRFEYRGFMIDCARHMFPVYELKRMIDTAAELKLNRFHWHLADDQGFRIELKSFPELTRFGSVRRGERFGRYIKSDKPYGGFYTQAEIKDIVDFCHERFIQVVPELDVPGHCSALLHVFPELGCGGKSVKIKMSNGIFKDVLCVGEEKTETVIRSIVSEMCELFSDEYFHIGGDEVPRDNWKTCPKCRSLMKSAGINELDGLQQLFINSVAAFLQEKGKMVIGWNECLKGGKLDEKIVVERWLDSNGSAIKAANSGRKVIMAPMNPFYADYPYSVYSLKKVYSYEPTEVSGLNKNGAENIIGVESPVWTEFITDCASLESRCFPRWFAVAETAWSMPENKSYGEFLSVCTKLARILHSNGVNCAPQDEWNPNCIKKWRMSTRFMHNYSTTGK